MKTKREVATAILYRKRGDIFEYFMQKRSADAVSMPDKLGLFGGGLDPGETILQALMRELQEELEYVPKAPVYFSRYEHATHINHVFLEEVGEDFEQSIHVHEGQYGKFLSYEEILVREDATPNTHNIIIQVARYLTSKK